MRIFEETKFLFNKLPYYLIFYPTSRCNASCGHCYNYSRFRSAAEEDELKPWEIEKFSEKLGHLKILCISGGEPTLRKDLYELIRIFYKNNKLRFISLHTNGFLTERVIAFVRNTLVNMPDSTLLVCLSIDGIKEDHDRIRGVKGGFRSLISTIDELKILSGKFKKLKLIVSTVYSNSTYKNIIQISEYVKNKLHLDHRISFVRGKTACPEERGSLLEKFKEDMRSLAPEIYENPFSAVSLKNIIDSYIPGIIFKNLSLRRQTLSCQAGRKAVVLYDNGDLYPCELLSEKFGNIRESEYNLKKIIFSLPSLELKNKIRRKRCFCSWENIISINIIHSAIFYPRLITRLLAESMRYCCGYFKKNGKAVHFLRRTGHA